MELDKNTGICTRFCKIPENRETWNNATGNWTRQSNTRNPGCNAKHSQNCSRPTQFRKVATQNGRGSECTLNNTSLDQQGGFHTETRENLKGTRVKPNRHVKSPRANWHSETGWRSESNLHLEPHLIWQLNSGLQQPRGTGTESGV